MNPVNPFSSGLVHSYIEPEGNSPLIVSPRSDEVNFTQWAGEHQSEIASAIKEYGALVFSGWGLTRARYSEAFTAATGMAPEPYRGDTPRVEEDLNVYRSTAVAPGHTIPLHQEVSGGRRQDMPKYISFFCSTPPQPGTGQTVVGSAHRVTEAIQASMPQLWDRMTSTTLTYTSRYLPTDSWATRWIKWLNPSHATIAEHFGTENREEIEEQCRQRGFTCRWDGGWAVISRSGVPATIESDGVTLFCNQVHTKLNPKLCGGWFFYLMARLLLYPTSSWLQNDVHFDDGTQISHRDSSRLISIFEAEQVGRDWRAGDLMIYDNVTTMHGKTPHRGERDILAAMSGSVEERSLY